MLEVGALVILLTGISLFFQDRFKIPLPITLLSFVLTSKLFGFSPFSISFKMFDEIILLLLPILIAVDALSLKVNDIKRNAISLFYMAGLSVVLTVVVGALVNHWILPSYNLSIPALFALFCMVAATDPVTVSSIFKSFHVPHDLKILAEGESLFNDVTALIIFGLAIVYLDGHHTTISDAITRTIEISLGAVVIGLIVGFCGLVFMGITNNPMVETFILLTVAFVSFVVSERFHVSGILSVIVGVITINHIISDKIKKYDMVISEEEKKKRRYRILSRITSALQEKSNQLMIEQNIRYTAILGTSVLFLSIGDMVSLDLMAKYWKEILSVFIATTIIRGLILSKFAFISNSIGRMQSISFHWWMVLTMAGTKGGLSILMIHMLPKDFIYLELFDSIIIGNILLSTFTYPFIMILIMKIYKNKFINA